MSRRLVSHCRGTTTSRLLLVAGSARVDAYMDKVLAKQKEEQIQEQQAEARAAADEELLSAGRGSYMKHDAEVC